MDKTTLISFFRSFLFMVGWQEEGRAAEGHRGSWSRVPVGPEGAAIGEAVVFSCRMVSFGERTVGNSHPLILM